MEVAGLVATLSSLSVHSLSKNGVFWTEQTLVLKLFPWWLQIRLCQGCSTALLSKTEHFLKKCYYCFLHNIYWDKRVYNVNICMWLLLLAAIVLGRLFINDVMRRGGGVNVFQKTIIYHFLWHREKGVLKNTNYKITWKGGEGHRRLLLVSCSVSVVVIQ